jgi:seryl-tRNA synthetase
MIDIEILRTRPDEVADALAARGVTDVDLAAVRAADDAWRELTTRVEQLRHEQNVAGKDVAQLSGTDREERLLRLRSLRDELRSEEQRLSDLARQRDTLLRRIPNVPRPSVPPGRSAEENKIEWTAPVPTLDFQPKPYLEIAEPLGIIDVERAARASGSRFGALVGDGALLEFALVRFAMEFLIARDFIPIVPPVMVRREPLSAMGYLERNEEEVYRTQDDLYLVGTSEQSVGAMHAGESLVEAQLPRRYAAFSTCFRREAGSYGKDTRGILRVHQFDKLEMFSLCRPEASDDEHQFLHQLERELMDTLDLPYRVVRLCAGDLGDPSAATLDIETWMPGSHEFRETHSSSNTTDFQTRRLGVSLRLDSGKSVIPHALNGTVFAIGRTVAAILENYQRADGSVTIPDALRPLMGNRESLAPVSVSS